MVEKQEVARAQDTTNRVQPEEPSQFQAHLEKQALQIKEKQKEAARLRANLEQHKKNSHENKAFQSCGTSAYRSRTVTIKVKRILGNKSDLKAALVAGDILLKPLSMRR